MNFFLGEFNRKGFRLHEPLYILILCVSNVTTNVAIGGSKGGRQGRAPPGGPNSFIFMQFSAEKIG